MFDGRWWQGAWGPGMGMDVFGAVFGLVFLLVLVWSLFWKGMALWRAARWSHRGWFVALLIINTFGILDILYIYVFSKRGRRREGPHGGPHIAEHHPHGPHGPHAHGPVAEHPPHFKYHHAPGEPAHDYHIGPADEKPKKPPTETT